MKPEDRKLLVNALCDTPQFQTERDRRTFIRATFDGHPNSKDLDKALQWLNWEGNRLVVADELLRHIEGRELAPGLPALRVLVEAIEPLTPDDRQEFASLKQHMGWLPAPPPSALTDPTGKPFDVFLCHNSKDKPDVKRIAEMLINRGLRPWLDEWSLQPGIPWQPEIEKQFETTKSAAVFLGAHGLGDWQNEEGQAILSRLKKRNAPVIPVFLATAPPDANFSAFIYSRTAVDFRKSTPDPLNQLIYGITGQNPAAQSTTAR